MRQDKFPAQNNKLQSARPIAMLIPKLIRDGDI